MILLCVITDCKTAVYSLTVDGQVDRTAGAVTGGVGHVAPEGSLVVAGHVVDDQGGSSISGVNSVTGCDLRAAVEPEEREGGTGGGAGQPDGAVGLHQVSIRVRHHDARDWNYWLKKHHICKYKYDKQLKP